MAAKINRTGKTYGDLTVLETIPGSNSKADTYLVKCNCCGNTMIIGIDALLKGLKCKDCRGKDRKRTYQDLVGEEHNGIKVISLAEDAIGSTGHRNIRYNCMCSCGKEFVAYRSSLLRGKVKSCGCCKHITEASKMLVDNAEAMQDYDFAKNKDVDVSMLTQGSNIVVWWKCSACGTEWQASVYHYIQRIKSCPICSTIDKGQTSFQEQAVAYYAKKYFSEAVIGNKKVIGKELDIYIPSIRTAVEYDGVRYHSDEKRVKNDEEKSEKCKQNGIRIIRIREHGLQENDMSIKFIDGNIFSRLSASKPTYICQQVNCKGVMGAGLAMQICIQWPVVYQRYLEFCYGNNGNKLGTYQEVLVEPKLYVVNLFGQNGYGRGERQTNYAALATALFSFFRDCAQKNQDVTIRLPYGLGCGLAGGDWNTVLDIISDAAKAWNVNVEIWKL